MSKEYFRNFAKVYPQLFELLWYTSLPCYEMPKLTKDPMTRSCHIAGEKVDCARIFSKVPTDQGMCCAINSEIALKKSVYSKKVEELQKSSEYMASGQKQPNRRKINGKVGIRNGIRLVMDLHSSSESLGSILNDFSAFEIFIGQPTDFPALSERKILIQPGHEHNIALTSTVFTDNDIRQLNPKDRDCFFTDEGNLELYKKYTFSNCMLECGIRETMARVGCSPWYLPHSDNATICDPWDERIFSSLLSNHSSNNNKCNCLPDCKMIKTTAKTSSAKFR